MVVKYEQQETLQGPALCSGMARRKLVENHVVFCVVFCAQKTHIYTHFLENTTAVELRDPTGKVLKCQVKVIIINVYVELCSMFRALHTVGMSSVREQVRQLDHLLTKQPRPRFAQCWKSVL